MVAEEYTAKANHLVIANIWTESLYYTQFNEEQVQREEYTNDVWHQDPCCCTNGLLDFASAEAFR